MSVSIGDPTIFDFLGDWLRYWKFSRESNRRLRELMPDRRYADIEAEYSERLERILRCALADEAEAIEPELPKPNFYAADGPRYANQPAALGMAEVLQFRRRRRH